MKSENFNLLVARKLYQMNEAAPPTPPAGGSWTSKYHYDPATGTISKYSPPKPPPAPPKTMAQKIKGLPGKAWAKTVHSFKNEPIATMYGIGAVFSDGGPLEKLRGISRRVGDFFKGQEKALRYGGKPKRVEMGN